MKKKKGMCFAGYVFSGIAVCGFFVGGNVMRRDEKINRALGG